MLTGKGMRLREIGLPAEVPLQVQSAHLQSPSCSFHWIPLQDALKRLLWGVLRQEGKKNTKPLTHGKQWEMQGGTGSGGKRPRPRSLDFESKVHRVPVSLPKCSASRLSWFSVIPLRAWANEASQLRAQGTCVLLHQKVARLIWMVSKSREAALKCLLRFDDPFQLKCLRFLVQGKSSRSQVAQQNSPKTRTTQLGPHCTGWHYCDYRWLVSVQFTRSVVTDPLRPYEPQHARPSCPSPTPRVHSNPCPSSRLCHPTISSSVVPFSSFPQTFPTSGSFQMSQLITSGGQSIGVSASAWVLPMNTFRISWSPLG